MSDNFGALVVAKDEGALAEAAAAHLAATIERAVAARGKALVALSGGNTPGPAYRKLAAMPIPWGSVHLLWVDDRSVPYDSPRSNYGSALRDWLPKTKLAEAQVHPMPPGGGDPEADARAYEAVIARCAGIEPGAVPTLDIAVLGVGDDGHTASLFPGTPGLAVVDRIVVPVPGEGEREPRLTLTFPVLFAARDLLILCQGAAKRPVVTAARAPGPPGPPMGDIPARRLREARGTITWIVDPAAAPSG